MMWSSPVGRRLLFQNVTLFYLLSLVYSLGVIKGMCGAPEPNVFAFVPVKPGGLETGSGTRNSELPGHHIGRRTDPFDESKPHIVSPEQWAEWKRRYGFAPLGEFCDNCRRVPGKCWNLQSCQDYCAEDCHGHGKDFTTSILCSWCGGARETRCKDWRSCREHCKVLCLHESYRLKVEADLKWEEDQTKLHHRKQYERYMQKKDAEDRLLVEQQKAVQKEHLEVIRKQLAELAGLEYHPLEEEL